MLPVGIGDEIRARRERAGLTQEALAALLGVHPDVIDDWEWGEGAPGPVEAWRLAALLGLVEGIAAGGGLAAGGEDSITIHLVPPGGRAASGPGPEPHPGGADLVPVPSHPEDPPPRPAPPTGDGPRAAVGPDGGRQAVRAASTTPRSQGRVRRLLAAAVLALLVAVAASSGLAAYEQSQAAARSAAEARDLRTTLVLLAGERDRLAARLAELGAALADSGLVVPGVPPTPGP